MLSARLRARRAAVPSKARSVLSTVLAAQRLRGKSSKPTNSGLLMRWGKLLDDCGLTSESRASQFGEDVQFSILRQ